MTMMRRQQRQPRPRAYRQQSQPNDGPAARSQRGPPSSPLARLVFCSAAAAAAVAAMLMLMLDGRQVLKGGSSVVDVAIMFRQGQQRGPRRVDWLTELLLPGAYAQEPETAADTGRGAEAAASSASALSEEQKDEQIEDSDATEKSNDGDQLEQTLRQAATKQTNHSDEVSFDELQHLHPEMHTDAIDDSVYDPFIPDPSCTAEESPDGTEREGGSGDCWSPPESTVETETVLVIDATCAYGGDDPSATHPLENDDGEEGADDEGAAGQCTVGGRREVKRDKHWGSDAAILKMRDKLRMAEASAANRTKENRRPPVFLMPGLASTRLVSWKFKKCANSLLSDIKVQDHVWMNINLLLQMATIDITCWQECMTLGLNQTDMDEEGRGCKLRPDEGLDAISSLAPGGVTSEVLVGGTNTVYAWLTQWLADNLGYDVSSIVGLPYDWRLSPDIMERRDGFLTLTRRRIEAAVKTNGAPGVMIAHSMGNIVFRYFLEWLRHEMHEEAYAKFIKRAERRRRAAMRQQGEQGSEMGGGLGGGRDATGGPHPPGWVSPPKNVHDRVANIANALTTGIDGLFRTYFEDYLPPQVDGDNSGDKNKPASSSDGSSGEGPTSTTADEAKQAQLWELAQIEGDADWLDWIQDHIWTYVGLSAPILGAVNPVRAALSGENMGLPMSEEVARLLELSFGSTNTAIPISTKKGFCDTDDMTAAERADLACLDELIPGIEASAAKGEDPWKAFPQLKALLKDRVDWDSDFPTFNVRIEKCEKGEKEPCKKRSTENFSAKDASSGDLFSHFARIWNEEGDPLLVKRDQLVESWWKGPVRNILNYTWDRPHIKHVIMAYGIDSATEVGYVYRKEEAIDKENNAETKVYDGVPIVKTVIWEEGNGMLVEEELKVAPKTIKEKVLGKKPKKRPLNGGDGNGKLSHSGDGTIPYLSLSWAHTWLLHATRAMRHSGHAGANDGQRISDNNALDSIKVSHRPKGGSEWIDGPSYGEEPPDEECGLDKDDLCDTGTAHPHGTKYKPQMVRFQSSGRSRSTGNEYTTAVIEAVGVEHKEMTRNYDILAAVFTDVLKFMHDDFQLV